MGTTSTITDVLSGNKAIRVEVGIDIKNGVIVGLVLFTLIVIAGIIIKKV